jgi:phage nucleotide-binding protein
VCGVQIKEVTYDPQKVMEFFEICMKIQYAKEYKKECNYLCNWCEYKDYCQKGVNYMLLPSSERRQVGQTTKRKIWLYGGAFSGKTTFVDKAPKPLNMNTDGNIQFVTMPYLPIKDTFEGRQKVVAWQVFKNAIAELEKKNNDFETIVVDLLEDAYEYCRLYIYDQMGITHESDDMRSWDKVTVEFLSTIRKLMNLDYENIILISHEDTTKDIMKRGGDKLTAIKPNIREKVANKVAGMVDIVARVVVDGDDRSLEFKSDAVVFGGGRLKNISKTSIPLDWDALIAVYDEANAGNVVKPVEPVKEEKPKVVEELKPAPEPTPEPAPKSEPDGEQPVRTRRTRKER